MTIDPAHHIYNIQLTENVFQWKKFFQNSPVQPLILNYVRQKTKFQVLVPMLIKIQICRLPERIRIVFSHIVRKDNPNPLEPSPQCQMVRLHIILFFSKYYYSLSRVLGVLSSWYIQYLNTYTVKCPPCHQRQPDHGSLPPLVRNHAKTWWGLRRHRQKIHRRIAGVSAHWFDSTAEKKAQVFTKKTYLLSPCTPVSGL